MQFFELRLPWPWVPKVCCFFFTKNAHQFIGFILLNLVNLLDLFYYIY
jgi:hypothetical protein